VWGNFLSDLGKSKTWSGVDNGPSATLFNTSVICLGVALLPFFAILPTTVARGKTIIRISGTVSAVGLIGIGLTPYDLYFVAHHVALGLWIGPMFILVIAYLIAAAWNDDASFGLIAWTLILAAAIGAYALAGAQGGYVAMQKVTAVVSVVWFSSIVYRVAFVTVEHISFRHTLVEREAERYMAILGRGHRQPTQDRGQAEPHWKARRQATTIRKRGKGKRQA
jgi:hypothetical protein